MTEEQRVAILSREEVFRVGFFRWFNVKFTFRRFDGTVSDAVERVVFERGDSVGMLLHDLTTDEIILVEQVRVATVGGGSGWILELPAGKIDGEDSAEATALREIREETGAEATRLEPISCFYPSPGSCSERLHLFYAPYADGLVVSDHAGLAAEDEDIRVLRVPLDEGLRMVEDGRIVDGKTILGLFWLKAKRAGGLS